MKLFIFALLIALASAKVRYDGYQVLHVEPQDEIQLDFINTLQNELEGKISFWSQPRTTKRPTDIMVQPRFQDELKEILDAKQIKYSVMMDDVQAVIDSQSRSHDSVKINADFDYSIYHTYDEIQAWVTEITDAHSTIANKFQIATSTEGRPINAVKISTGSGRKAVYWQGGIHAREWISPATVMYITKSMLENYRDGSDTDVTEILNTFDFYIVPSLNVDGYSYTWTDDRMWRKTRSRNSGSTCRGVDPNRNYEYEWGGEGASTSPCSSTYRGSKAFSEPEISETTTYLLGTKQEFVSFIDFHSYSQLWLAPWSYSARAVLPEEKDDHDAAAAKAVNALRSVYGTEYTYGPSARTLYAASGCSEDWGFATLKAKYSYVVELRDKGNYGFLLPENQIIPTGEETYEAIKAFCKHMMDEYKLK